MERAFNSVLVLEDQDCRDCHDVKQNLSEIASPSHRQVLIRIVCHELEAWYWGDLPAVSAAFAKDLTEQSRKKRYRNPDEILHPKEELKKFLPELQQVSGAKAIAPHMSIDKNTSASFQAFVSGVRKLCGLDESEGIGFA